MDTNHNRIKVADLEINEQNKILTTNTKGELEFSDINNIKTESYNALDCIVPGKALDARQGKVLKDLIDDANELLTSDNVDLNTLQKLGDAIETVRASLNTVSNDISNIQASNYNALDYILPGKTLDARQGKVLKDLIDDANELLASDNADLNTLQKLGDAIEMLRNSLGSILVNDLSTGGTAKALTAEMGKVLQNNKVDKVSGKSLLSDTEITRLGTLSNYVHPANHPASIITQDSGNRFVSDTEKNSWNSKQSALGYTAESASNKNIANGYAGLGADGKLISSQLPAITVNDTFVIASEAAMLALTAETGDIAVRTDLSKSFILKGSNSAILNDWQELLTPTSEVTKVFGRNGAVTAQAGDYNADQITETESRRFQTPSQQAFNDATSSIQTQLNSKVSTTGSGASGTWGINITGSANSLYNDSTNIILRDGWARSQTQYGFIDFGPANDSHAHIYTDRPNFYFNKDLLVLGNTVWHSGNFNPNNVVKGENARGRSISKNNGNANPSDETNPSGFFYGVAVTGMPNDNWWNWINVAGGDWSGADGYGFQIANSFWNGNLVSRNMTSGSWSGWRTILDTENLTNYATKLNGSNASGTWPISVTGSSTGFPYQSGSQIDTLTGNNSTIVREEHPSSGFNYTSTLHMGSGDGRQQLTIARDGSGMKFRGSNYSSGASEWSSWKTVLNDANYSAYSTFSGTITTAQTSVLGNFGSLNLWAGVPYPTLFGSTSERWIMHANPHICYTENGAHDYTGSMNGATIRFAADPNASSSWDLGVGTNGVGRDSFSIGRNGSSYFRLSPSSGNADFSMSVIAPAFYGSGNGLTGTAGSLNIGGNAETATSSRRIAFTDGPRTLSDRLPNTFARSVNFDFVNSAVVDGSGNYGGVMTFTPWDGTTSSTGDSSYQLAFRNETGVNGSGLPGLRLRKGIDTTWGGWYDLLHSGNYASYSAFSGAITGSSLNVTGDVTAFSDARVKENIRPIENVIERIQASRGVVYDRIDNEQKDNIGFIAQELEENFPELVLTREDGTKAVKYQNAAAVLFEAVKQQQLKIEEQEQKLKFIIKHLNLNE